MTDAVADTSKLFKYLRRQTPVHVLHCGQTEAWFPFLARILSSCNLHTGDIATGGRVTEFRFLSINPRYLACHMPFILRF